MRRSRREPVTNHCCRDDTSRTALHWAAETGAADVAAVLVAAEAEAYQTQLQQLEAEAAAAAEVAAQAGIAHELPAQPAKPPTIYELQASSHSTIQHLCCSNAACPHTNADSHLPFEL